MRKTSQLLETWNREVANALSSFEEPARLAGAISRMVQALIPGDIIHVTAWHDRGQLQELHQDPADVELPGRPLPDAYFQLDPFYLAFREGRSGSLALRELAPPGFTQSAYYQQIYLAYGYADTMLHLARPSEDTSIWIEFGRRAGREDFTRAERELHKAMFPAVEAFSARMSDLVWDAGQDGSGSNEADLQSAFEHFGEGCLTKREAAVIRLVLRGHNTRSVGSELEISPETVKLHRKHAYAKLRVSSQGELFSQFIRVLQDRNPPPRPT